MKRLLAAFLALLALAGCASVEPAPSPSPSPGSGPAPVLAFFGSSQESWYEALSAAAEDWCGREGWELVEYDCLGMETTQSVQVDDLLRNRGAKMAVLCAVSRTGLETNAAALAARGVSVVLLSDRPLEPETAGDPEASETPADPLGEFYRLGPSAQDIWEDAAAFFREGTAWDGQVVILHDVETDPLEAAARTGLEEAGVGVAQELYTWGSVEFTKEFLADALARRGEVGGVVCFSRTGAQGARAALEETGLLGEVKVLCLDCGWELLADLDRGELDGVMALREEEAAGALEKALSDAAQGKGPGGATLEMELWTKPRD